MSLRRPVAGVRLPAQPVQHPLPDVPGEMHAQRPHAVAHRILTVPNPVLIQKVEAPQRVVALVPQFAGAERGEVGGEAVGFVHGAAVAVGGGGLRITMEQLDAIRNRRPPPVWPRAVAPLLGTWVGFATGLVLRGVSDRAIPFSPAEALTDPAGLMCVTGGAFAASAPLSLPAGFAAEHFVGKGAWLMAAAGWCGAAVTAGPVGWWFLGFIDTLMGA